MSFLLAKKEPGSGGPYNWDVAGEAGAIEVHPAIIQQLLAIPGNEFFVVEKLEEKPAKKVEEVVAEEVVAEEAVAEEVPAEVAEEASAEEVKTPKRRSTKE
jgi:hypothetical protein